MCNYCEKEEQLLTRDVPYVIWDSVSGEEELQVIIDRGYLRLGKTEDMQQMEDWMPLWFDPSPEERKLNAEKEVKVKGMIAEKDIEHYRSLGINI